MGFTFGSLLSFHLNTLDQTIFDDNMSTTVKVFIALAIFTYAVTTVYIFYLVTRLCDSQGYMLWRNRIFKMLTIIYVSVTLIALANFALSFYSLGREVFVVIINYNIFVWAHQYLYTPTDTALQ